VDSFQQLILGDLALAGATVPQRIDQSQNLVEATVPASSFRGGRMQWLYPVSELLAQGIRPDRNVFLSEGNEFRQRRGGAIFIL
jgi:hypothetical protein